MNKNIKLLKLKRFIFRAIFYAINLIRAAKKKNKTNRKD
jgi:hypothetical protein